MPWQTTGFSRNYSWVSDANAGLLIDATRMDTDTNDIAGGLTQLRGMSQNGSLIWGGTATGSANAIVVTLSPAPTSYTAGLRVSFLPGAANTGPTTLQIGALAAVPVHNGGAALTGGEFQTGVLDTVEYDGTNFQILGGGITNITVGPYLSGGGNYGTVDIALITPVAVAAGGTGAVTLTQYAVLTGNGTGAIGAVAPGAANTLLASAGTGAAPAFLGLSTLLDVVLGNTQGSLAMRGATSWQALTPGPVGTVLSSGGSGANLAWLSSLVNTIVAGTGISVNAGTGNVTVSLISPVAIANGGTGAVSAAAALTSLGAAPIASPNFSGTPTAPTAAANTNSTQLATCAFVMAQVTASVSGVASIAAGAGLSGGGTGAVTLSVAPAGITNSLLATMPTATIKGNNAGAVGAPLDLTVAQTMAMLRAAPLASPAFTGNPTAPTPVATDNSTSIATTAFVRSQPLPLTVSDIAPTLANGAMWFDSVGTQLYVGYNDGTSTQWVVANNFGNIAAPLAPLPVTQGGTGAGSFTANHLLLGAGTAALTASPTIQTDASNSLIVNQNVTALPIAGAGTAVQLAAADGNSAQIVTHSWGTAGSAQYFTQARGTAAAPTAVQNGDTLGQIIAQGYDGTAVGNATQIQLMAAENWTTTAHGGMIRFNTVGAGAGVGLGVRMQIGLGTIIGNPTGGDVGSGTINTSGAYYVNGNNITPGQIHIQSSFPVSVPAHVGGGQMVGLGYTYMPQSSTRVLVVISGSVTIDVANQTNTAQLRYGTGTPPVNGAAATGATIIGFQYGAALPAGVQVPAPLVGVATGLTIGTTYWFDVAMTTSTGTADFFNVGYSFIEV
jgi:hypothetical protein